MHRIAIDLSLHREVIMRAVNIVNCCKLLISLSEDNLKKINSKQTRVAIPQTRFEIFKTVKSTFIFSHTINLLQECLLFPNASIFFPGHFVLNANLKVRIPILVASALKVLVEIKQKILDTASAN